MSIEQLAQQMNVSPAYVRSMAQSIADSIDIDKAGAFFTAADESLQAEMVEAYAPVAVSKMEQFFTRYHSCPAAREAFQGAILEQV